MDEQSLPPPQPPNRSEAYSLSRESTSSDVDGDRQQLNAAKSGGTDDDDDEDDDEDADEEDDNMVVPPEAATIAAAAADCASGGAADRRPLSADMYFMARRSVVILVNFSLCASTAR